MGLSMMLLLFLVALLSPWLSPYDPLKVDTANTFLPPSKQHLFGTDDLGRDVFSRVLHGAGISIRVVVIVLGVATAIGVPFGAVAGYWGSPIDDIIMRITDIFLAFPTFILAMVIGSSLGRGLEYGVLSVGIAYWPMYARLIRGQVLSIKNEAYVLAAQAIGASRFRIVFVHILPNCIVPLIVQLSLHAGMAILHAGAMSLVGLGAQAPSPEWGAEISHSRQFITSYWWIPFFPGLAISFTVAAYMFLGDGLRDLLDPRLKHLLRE